MKNLSEYETPETDTFTSKYDQPAETVMLPYRLTKSLEQRLAACREALESITHDMGASPQIHKLCGETLELTK